MTDHPCKGMTKSQIAAFEQIAVGVALPRVHRKVIDALLKRGVIEQGEDKEVGRDRFGVIALAQYHVPLPVHMQWCDWCSEHVSDDLTA